MIGKADIPDLAGLLFLPDPVLDAELFEPFPLGDVRQMVHQIVIHIIRAQAGKLLAEKTVQRGGAADHVLGQLGGDMHLIADAVALKDFADGFLTAGIDIGGIKIIDARAEGGENLLLRLVQINAAALPGKAHASEAKEGKRLPGPVLSVLHRFCPPAFKSESILADLGENIKKA